MKGQKQTATPSGSMDAKPKTPKLSLGQKKLIKFIKKEGIQNGGDLSVLNLSECMLDTQILYNLLTRRRSLFSDLKSLEGLLAVGRDLLAKGPPSNMQDKTSSVHAEHNNKYKPQHE